MRIWACTRERRILYIVELADQKALDAFSAGLAAGRDFDSLAKELHVHKDKQPAGNRTTLVKNDNVELSRVAFSTPEGQVAGPLEADGGRHLMIRVDKSLAPITGPWKEIAAAIEQSLVEDPVDEFEFIQWRSEMVKSYSVDTAPFFRIVGDAR